MKNHNFFIYRKTSLYRCIAKRLSKIFLKMWKLFFGQNKESVTIETLFFFNYSHCYIAIFENFQTQKDYFKQRSYFLFLISWYFWQKYFENILTNWLTNGYNGYICQFSKFKFRQSTYSYVFWQINTIKKLQPEFGVLVQNLTIV